MKTERRQFRVGDIVKVKDTWLFTGFDQTAGDVGVITGLRRHGGSEGCSYYITFGRTGPDDTSWGADNLDLVTPVEDTARG